MTGCGYTMSKSMGGCVYEASYKHWFFFFFWSVRGICCFLVNAKNVFNIASKNINISIKFCHLITFQFMCLQFQVIMFYVPRETMSASGKWNPPMFSNIISMMQMCPMWVKLIFLRWSLGGIFHSIHIIVSYYLLLAPFIFFFFPKINQ